MWPQVSDGKSEISTSIRNQYTDTISIQWWSLKNSHVKVTNLSRISQNWFKVARSRCRLWRSRFNTWTDHFLMLASSGNSCHLRWYAFTATTTCYLAHKGPPTATFLTDTLNQLYKHDDNDDQITLSKNYTCTELFHTAYNEPIPFYFLK